MKYSNPTTDCYGNKAWRNEKGQLHREGGLPAVEWTDGTKRWYLNGVRYRIDEWIMNYE